MRKKTSRSRQKRQKTNTVLAYDIGGTKVLAALVSKSGRILKSVREPVDFSKGSRSLIDQLNRIGKSLAQGQDPDSILGAGVGCAGPLDPRTGTLLNPTNLRLSSKSPQPFPLAKLLKSQLQIPVFLENDAAAALLAEVWKGRARGYKNAMILTLGTGLGTAVLAEGHLLRGGRGLHTEAGHIPLNIFDRERLCGCGNPGCAEAYLSGNGFAAWANFRSGLQLSATQWAERAGRSGPHSEAAEHFTEYGRALASAIAAYVALFSPEIVVLTGGFASTSPYFLSVTKKLLPTLLEKRRVGIDLLPKVALSALDGQAGVIGAAKVAWLGLGK